MRNFRKSVLTSFLLLLAASGANAQKEVDVAPSSDAAIMGKLVGRLYINNLLKFQLQLPEDGVILNQAVIDVYKNAGLDNLRTSANSAGIANAEKNEVILINYLAKPLGSPGNSALVITALRQPKNVTAAIVVAATVSGLSASGKFELSKSLSQVAVGTMKANGIEGTLTTSSGATVKERILIVMRNGYSLSFCFAGPDDAALDRSQALLRGFKFLSK
jgi:hypothetical protein